MSEQAPGVESLETNGRLSQAAGMIRQCGGYALRTGSAAALAVGSTLIFGTAPASADPFLSNERYTEDPSAGTGCSYNVGQPVTNQDGSITLGKITATVPQNGECSDDVSSARTAAGSVLSLSGSFVGVAGIGGSTLSFKPDKGTNGTYDMIYTETLTDGTKHSGEADITVTATAPYTYTDHAYVNHMKSTSGAPGSEGTFDVVVWNTDDDADNEATYTITADGCKRTESQSVTVADPPQDGTIRHTKAGTVSFEMPQGTYAVTVKGNGQTMTDTAYVTNGNDPNHSAACLPTTAPAAPVSGESNGTTGQIGSANNGNGKQSSIGQSSQNGGQSATVAGKSSGSAAKAESAAGPAPLNYADPKLIACRRSENDYSGVPVSCGKKIALPDKTFNPDKKGTPVWEYGAGTVAAIATVFGVYKGGRKVVRAVRNK